MYLPIYKNTKTTLMTQCLVLLKTNFSLSFYFLKIKSFGDTRFPSLSAERSFLYTVLFEILPLIVEHKSVVGPNTLMKYVSLKFRMQKFSHGCEKDKKNKNKTDFLRLLCWFWKVKTAPISNQ